MSSARSVAPLPPPTNSSTVESGSDVGSPTSSSSPADQLSYTVELYENERWFPLSGWCTKRLPADRPHLSSKDGKTALNPTKWPLPAGYEWVGDWAIDKDHRDGTDPEGWRYAFSWGTRFQPTCSSSTCVRRRRWIRTMIRTPTPQQLVASAASATSTSGGSRGGGAAPVAVVYGLPFGVVSITNESFDLCGRTTVGVHRAGAAAVAAAAVVAPAVALSSVSSTIPLPSSPPPLPPQQQQTPTTAWTPTQSLPSHVATAPPVDSDAAAAMLEGEEEEDNNDNTLLAPRTTSLAPEDSSQDYDSASTRYFRERQATTSVIGRRRVVHPPDPNTDDDFSPKVSVTAYRQQPQAGSAEQPATAAAEVLQEAPPPHHKEHHSEWNFHDEHEEEFVEEPIAPDDEDALYYGFAPSVCNRGEPQQPADTQEGLDVYSFQKTLSEIVEDVERSEDEYALQAPPTPAVAAGNASSSAVRFTTSRHGGDQDDDEAHSDALFASVFQHFVGEASK